MSLYNCHYSAFFQCLSEVEQVAKHDRYYLRSRLLQIYDTSAIKLSWSVLFLVVKFKALGGDYFGRNPLLGLRAWSDSPPQKLLEEFGRPWKIRWYSIARSKVTAIFAGHTDTHFPTATRGIFCRNLHLFTSWRIKLNILLGILIRGTKPNSKAVPQMLVWLWGCKEKQL